MNIKNLFPKIGPKTAAKVIPKKLNAATARRAPIAEDYDTEEPNVRLSRAFIVVMLLHVVAVGGIFAFSSLKKSTTIAEPEAAEASPKAENLPAGSRLHEVRDSDSVGSIAAAFGLTRQDLETANSSKDLAQLQIGDKLVIPAKSAAQPVPLDVQKLLQLPKKTTASQPAKEPVKEIAKTTVKPALPVSNPAANAEKFYVVQKGDNPVGIAKKLNIKYTDLVEANKITDPKKLQIGQKLIVP